MKYVDVIIFIFLLSIFSVSFSNGIRILKNLSQLNNEYIERKSANKFIFESFKNTCDGKGFDSLIQWQKSCKAMWNLNYIGWSDVRDFSILPNSVTKNILYGNWVGDDFSGEVYWDGESL